MLGVVYGESWVLCMPLPSWGTHARSQQKPPNTLVLSGSYLVENITLMRPRSSSAASSYGKARRDLLVNSTVVLGRAR